MKPKCESDSKLSTHVEVLDELLAEARKLAAEVAATTEKIVARANGHFHKNLAVDDPRKVVKPQKD